uniref:Uncharacterized protein n=1 Tax=Ciona intestinalis TaxID=7719 RepID=H2XLR2_CIOIN
MSSNVIRSVNLSSFIFILLPFNIKY